MTYDPAAAHFMIFGKAHVRRLKARWGVYSSWIQEVGTPSFVWPTLQEFQYSYVHGVPLSRWTLCIAFGGLSRMDVFSADHRERALHAFGICMAYNRPELWHEL